MHQMASGALGKSCATSHGLVQLALHATPEPGRGVEIFQKSVRLDTQLAPGCSKYINERWFLDAKSKRAVHEMISFPVVDDEGVPNRQALNNDPRLHFFAFVFRLGKVERCMNTLSPNRVLTNARGRIKN